MIRIGFAGVPGAGKTSTARALAAECRGNEAFKNVELVSEYARRYISKYGKVETVWEQFRILKKQLDWEDSCGDVDVLITDGPVFQGLMYAQMLRERKDRKEVMVINDLMSELNKINNPLPRYDVIFHLPPVLNPIEDGIRSSEQFDPTWRADADAELRATFRCFKPCLFYTVKALRIEDRVKECMAVLESLGLYKAMLYDDAFDEKQPPKMPRPRMENLLCYDKNGSNIYVDTLVHRCLQVSEPKGDGTDTPVQYGKALRQHGGILVVTLAGETFDSVLLNGSPIECEWNLSDVEVHVPKYYTECMGVVHESNATGDALCGHGAGEPVAEKPKSMDVFQDCPICFGGGGA